jgi:hypothetical protein
MGNSATADSQLSRILHRHHSRSETEFWTSILNGSTAWSFCLIPQAKALNQIAENHPHNFVH